MNELSLTFAKKGEITHLKEYKNKGCLKASRVLNDEFIYLVTLGGGLVSGEKYKQNITLLDDAKMAIKPQSNQKVYKSQEGKFAVFNSEIHLGKNSFLDYENLSLIAYEDAKFRQISNFYLEKNSKLIYIDGVSSGYSKDDKLFSFSELFLVNNFYADKKLIFSDKTFLGDEMKSFGIFKEFKFSFFMLSYGFKALKFDDVISDDLVISSAKLSDEILICRVLSNSEFKAIKELHKLKERLL